MFNKRMNSLFYMLLFRYLLACAYILSFDILETISSNENYQTGPVILSQLGSPFDFTNNGVYHHQATKRPANFLTGLIGENGDSKLKIGKIENVSLPETLRKNSNSFLRKQEENLSVDCFAKRNEILHKHQTSLANRNNHRRPNSFQRLKPKQDTNDSSDAPSTDSNSAEQVDNEHVPKCNQEGGYEPIQCHKIGYCWCVNKFGQAIKNSATLVGQKPVCSQDLYQTESNGQLVVTGTTEKRINGILKGPKLESNQHHSNQDTDNESNQDGKDQQVGGENDFERRVSTTKEPSLALLPNDCSLSRSKARERSLNYTSDVSIWIPRCDPENNNLYAEKQCHVMKLNSLVCWCVYQITGLPLRTNEPLGRQSNSLNCTEVKRMNGIVEKVLPSKEKADHVDEVSSSGQVESYKGFSELCDLQRRVEFVSSLIGQFKIQIQDFTKDNPGFECMNSAELQNANESQIAECRFATLDLDSDGVLDNREWFKFKDNFKLIDRIEELNLQRMKKSKHSVIPLYIIRNQRRCWRDFLLYCNDGKLSNDVPINLTNWINCTQLPSKSNILPLINNSDSSIVGLNNTEKVPDSVYESLKAVARSKHKNPFLGILKPD